MSTAVRCSIHADLRLKKQKQNISIFLKFKLEVEHLNINL